MQAFMSTGWTNVIPEFFNVAIIMHKLNKNRITSEMCNNHYLFTLVNVKCHSAKNCWAMWTLIKQSPMLKCISVIQPFILTSVPGCHNQYCTVLCMWKAIMGAGKKTNKKEKTMKLPKLMLESITFRFYAWGEIWMFGAENDLVKTTIGTCTMWQNF